MRLFLLSILVLLLSGCSGMRDLASALNERHVNSCIWISSAYPGFYTGRAVIATGGIPVEKCMDH